MQKLLNLIGSRREWAVMMAALGLAGSAWIGFSTVPGAETTAGRIPSPREGFLAPDFTLEDLAGNEIRLSELRGQAVVINLWASWCPPCRAEMPALQRVFAENEDRGLVVLAVNTTYQDTEAAAAGFVDRFGLTFPVALDQTGNVSNGYLLRALPTTFFVDRDGVIQQVVIGGPMSEATIRSGVEEILRQNP